MSVSYKELMVGQCRRCESIRAYLYEERHQAVCTFCLPSGFLIHMRLIPKEPIDIEEVATVKKQYLTWEEYCERHKLDSVLGDTNNLEQGVQGLSEDPDT